MYQEHSFSLETSGIPPEAFEWGNRQGDLFRAGVVKKKVFRLPVPADVNEPPPFWSATTAQSCISHGTWAPSVTSRRIRLARRHKIRSFSFNPAKYATGILSSGIFCNVRSEIFREGSFHSTCMR
jgi:hypothetical protein